MGTVPALPRERKRRRCALVSSPSPSSVIDVLTAVGARANFDSKGLSVTGPEEVLTDELLGFVKAHRAELVNHLLDALHASAPPPNPAGTSRCADCCEPCGSAARCPGCAAARVPGGAARRKRRSPRRAA